MKAAVNAARHSLRFRSFQQKLGIYAFILSLLAVYGVSFFSYWVARNQVRRDREQLAEVQVQQISDDLAKELDNIAEDLLLWRDIGYIRISLKQHRVEQASAFFDNIIRQRRNYDLVFTLDLEGRIGAINGIGKNMTGEPYSNLLGNLSDSWLQDTA